jgi:putative ABC transport system permease protein
MIDSIWKTRKIPLSWLLLTRQPGRLLIALAGIGFAGILIFLQLGFRQGLFDSSVLLNKRFDADIVLISPRSISSISMAGFPRRRLVQAMADPAVVGTTPVHWNAVRWRNPETRKTRSMLALGFEPGDPLFTGTNMGAQTEMLKQKGRVVFDELSRPEFGPIGEWFRQGKIIDTEVGFRRVRVGGLVALGPSFGIDGTIITSRETFYDLLPNTPKGSIELGLIRLRPQEDPASVAMRLRSLLPDDVTVYTKQQFIQFEKDYWQTSTAIGFIFSLGTAMGFIVGCVIVYQILHSDVTDHLPEYATLMAMGYPLPELLGVVAREGLLLALLGYIPAWLVAQALYYLIRSSTRLPVVMNSERTIMVFSLILLMCMGSAMMAMRKLGDADPAEIF